MFFFHRIRINNSPASQRISILHFHSIKKNSLGVKLCSIFYYLVISSAADWFSLYMSTIKSKDKSGKDWVRTCGNNPTKVLTYPIFLEIRRNCFLIYPESTVHAIPQDRLESWLFVDPFFLSRKLSVSSGATKKWSSGANHYRREGCRNGLSSAYIVANKIILIKPLFLIILWKQCRI